MRNEFNLLLMNIELWGTSGIPKFYFEVLLTWSSPSLLCVWIQAANPKNLGLLLFIFAPQSLFSRSQRHLLFTVLGTSKGTVIHYLYLAQNLKCFYFLAGRERMFEDMRPSHRFSALYRVGNTDFFSVVMYLCIYMRGRSGRKVCCLIVVVICTSDYLTPASTYIVCCVLYFLIIVVTSRDDYYVLRGGNVKTPVSLGAPWS